MVETQLCKLRGRSDTFVGRAYSILRSISFYNMVLELNLRYYKYSVSQKIVRTCFLEKIGSEIRPTVPVTFVAPSVV